MGQAEIMPATAIRKREAAFAIREAVFVDEQKVPLLLEFDGLDDDAEHLLAMLDGRAAGTLRIRQIGGTIGKIERVAVLKTARGRSVGADLIRAALRRLRERGLREAKLHAQTHALDFYTKLGFAAYGEVFDEDDIPHRAMHIDL